MSSNPGQRTCVREIEFGLHSHPSLTDLWHRVRRMTVIPQPHHFFQRRRVSCLVIQAGQSFPPLQLKHVHIAKMRLGVCLMRELQLRKCFASWRTIQP